MGAVTIRPAVPEDAPALLAIYAPYVRETAVTFEYEVPTPEEFAGRIRRTLERYPYLTAQCGGEVLGPGALSGRPAHPESQRLHRRPRPGGGPLPHRGQRRLPRQAGLSAGGAVPQVRL